MVSELIATVLTDNYIPPIILGEEVASEITRLWVIDGLQRSSTLAMFRYGNTKITKTVEENLVTYQRKMLDGNGNPKRDAKGEIIWETATCDIRNKTYDQLPEELKERFNGYQVDTVIHQDCNTTEISRLVRKYNNHTAMNAAQKAFTYADSFAKDIREITENRFFLDVYTCSRNDRKNGTVERIVGDTVLLCKHPDQYKGKTLQNFMWLNENASISDFEEINGLLTRLTASINATKEIRALFNSKHAHIFVAAFKIFAESGHEDKEFGKFLEWFVNGGNETEIGGKTWDMLNADRATRDIGTVYGKFGYLVALFEKYFQENRQIA